MSLPGGQQKLFRNRLRSFKGSQPVSFKPCSRAIFDRYLISDVRFIGHAMVRLDSLRAMQPSVSSSAIQRYAAMAPESRPPIRVLRTRRGLFVILDGHHRAEIARCGGEETIHAAILEIAS